MAATTPTEQAERRRHRRLDADLDATCRRIGGRATPSKPMRLLDISLGGARVLGSGHFVTGDVVLVTVPVDARDLVLKGLVVSSSIHADRTDQNHAHIAFTSLGEADRDRLARLLEQLERTDNGSH